MALEDLERKLHESFNDLRTENKSLIDLLKFRQNQLKDSLLKNNTNPNIRQTRECGENTHQRLSDLRHTMENTGQLSSSKGINTDTIISLPSTDSNKARELLAHCMKGSNTAMSQFSQHDRYEIDSDEESQTFTSTPDLTPIKLTRTTLSSPKSILKRRKIIDDNVKVISKYKHTPIGTSATGKMNGLNFSYTDEDDDGELSQYTEQDTLDGSFLEEYKTQNSKIEEKSLIRHLEHTQNKKKLDDDIRKIEDMVEQNLLDAAGNDRQHANVVKNINQRPRNPVFDINAKESSRDILGKQVIANKKTSPFNQSLNPTREGRPLLGYDWIAGILENEGILKEQTEDMFLEIEEFRRKNKEDCIGTAAAWDKTLDLRRPVSPEVEDPSHTCIHSFSINDRLFTESINLNDEGKSICPVCLVARKPPTREDPAFVRVSIPRSTIEAPYKVIPHTRKSFDPTDSYALSKHCLAGWQNAKPYTLPTASTLDIKDKIIPKQTTSYDEARKVAESFSRMGRLKDGKDLPEDKLAKELTARTHNLKYELEAMKDFFYHNNNLPTKTN